MQRVTAGDVFATAAPAVAQRLAPQRAPPCGTFEEEVVDRRLQHTHVDHLH